MKTRQKIRKGIILASFFLFPATFYYFSPVVIIQSTRSGIVNGSFIVFLLMFLDALFLGRAYCGWICPGAGCQEAIFAARDNKVTSGNIIKWIIWIPWVGTILSLAIRHGGYKEIDFFYQTKYGLSISDSSSLIAYLCVLFFLITIPAFLMGRRSFCHHLCWMAPFMILGRKIRNSANWASLQLKADSENCGHCHTCAKNCPMSLPVEMMVQNNKMENTECILCGTCVDGCEFNVITFAFFNGAQQRH
jgi:ferredoxin-type protein NapH